MFCEHCGSEIEDDALFCAHCGQAVEGDGEANADTAPLAESDATKEMPTASKEDTEAAAAEGEAADASADETEASGSTNFKAAVGTSKKRARRAIPIPLLIALALALLTGAALAAIYAYNTYFAAQPEAEQTEEAAEEPEETEPIEEAPQVVEEPEEGNSAEEEALAAYDGILQEYRAVFNAIASGKSADELWDTYPNVNLEPMLDYFESNPRDDYQYTYKDLNGDGVPELLIGSNAPYYSWTNTIYNIWTYSGGELVNVADGMTRDCYALQTNNVIMSYGNGGAYSNGVSMCKLNASNELVAFAGISEEGSSSSVTYTKYADGKTETGTCAPEEFTAMVKEFVANYPEDLTVNWKSF